MFVPDFGYAVHLPLTFVDQVLFAGGELLSSLATAAPVGALLALVIPLVHVLFRAAVATVAIISAAPKERSEVAMRIFNALLKPKPPGDAGL